MDIVQAIELLRQIRTSERCSDVHPHLSIDWTPAAPRPPKPAARRPDPNPQPTL